MKNKKNTTLKKKNNFVRLIFYNKNLFDTIFQNEIVSKV